MKRFLFRLLLSLAVVNASAADRCVRLGATGTGSGLDWTNAYTTLAAAESAIARGETIWISAGVPYAAATFDTAPSSTTLITIKRATIAAHGPSGGWSDAYDGDVIVNGGCWFKTDYWLVDGVSRTDWRGTYGIKFRNNNGVTAVPLDTDACVRIGDATLVSGGNVSNVTLQYIEAEGSGDRTGTYTDSALTITYTTGVPSNIVVNSCRLHKAGTVSLNARQTTGLIVDHSLIENNQSTGTNHGEAMAIKEQTASFTLRFSRIVNGEGTAFLGSPSGGSGFTYHDWKIHGNIFYYNASTAQVDQGGAGNLIQLFNYANFTGIFAFVYNTIYRVDVPNGPRAPQGNAGLNINVIGTPATINNGLIENNLWASTTTYISSDIPAGLTGSYTWDYNAYFDASNTGDSSTHKTSSSGDPFIDAAGENFRLTANTTAGAVLDSEFNTDPDGNPRTTRTRGAYEFTGGGGTNAAANPSPLRLLIGTP